LRLIGPGRGVRRGGRARARRPKGGARRGLPPRRGRLTRPRGAPEAPRAGPRAIESALNPSSGRGGTRGGPTWRVRGVDRPGDRGKVCRVASCAASRSQSQLKVAMEWGRGRGAPGIARGRLQGCRPRPCRGPSRRPDSVGASFNTARAAPDTLGTRGRVGDPARGAARHEPGAAGARSHGTARRPRPRAPARAHVNRGRRGALNGAAPAGGAAAAAVGGSQRAAARARPAGRTAGAPAGRQPELRREAPALCAPGPAPARKPPVLLHARHRPSGSQGGRRRARPPGGGRPARRPAGGCPRVPVPAAARGE
jgi:hypothetical protein